MKQVLIAFLTSEAGVNALIAIAAVILYVLRQYAKDRAQRIIDLAVQAANAVEKAIPDNTPNKSLAKADLFLRKFCAAYAQAEGKTPSQAVLDRAKGVAEAVVASWNAGRSLRSGPVVK
jgi:predicted lipoprotein